MKLIKSTVQYRLLNEDDIVIATSFYNGKLSLKNCQAIELDYDLYELAEEHFHISQFNVGNNRNAFRAGFQKALEILGDKKFTYNQMVSAITESSISHRLPSLIIQDLQQTEWDVVIVEEQVYDGLDEIAQPQYVKQPKLDEKGQLILKRK